MTNRLDSKGKNTLSRRRGENETAQWYQDRSKAFILVGYRQRADEIDRSKPVRIKVNHAGAIVETSGTKTKINTLPSESPLRSRSFGSSELKRSGCYWDAAFAELCDTEGFVKSYRVSQGCLIEKTDGSILQTPELHTK